jgi:hypothetical protein
MKRHLILAVALFAVGCGGNVVGPFQQRKPMRVDDPNISIPEQEARGRDRLALPDQSRAVAPGSYGDFPIPNGGQQKLTTP